MRMMLHSSPCFKDATIMIMIMIIITGGIIGDGDRKRAPFLVLGLSP